MLLALVLFTANAQSSFDAPPLPPLRQYVGRANVEVFSMPITQPCFRHPLGAGRRLTQVFGGGRHHLGEDWALARGESRGGPIYATADGTVTTAESAGPWGWGNVIRIVHRYVVESTGDSRLHGYEFVESLYAHMEMLHVKEGERVRMGQLIGTIGDAGGSTSPHLHFELRSAINMDLHRGYGRGASGWLEPSVFIAQMQGGCLP